MVTISLEYYIDNLSTKVQTGYMHKRNDKIHKLLSDIAYKKKMIQFYSCLYIATKKISVISLHCVITSSVQPNLGRHMDIFL